MSGLFAKIVQFVPKLSQVNVKGLLNSRWVKNIWLSIHFFVRSAPSAKPFPWSVYLASSDFFVCEIDFCSTWIFSAISRYFFKCCL